jgi:hypothetical protein
MLNKALKQKTHSLAIGPKSRYALLRHLILDGFFDLPVLSEQIVHRVREKFGKRWKTSYIQTYMQKFMSAGIIHAVKLDGAGQNYWVLTSVRREDALRAIGKKKKVLELEQQLFSENVLRKLRKNFGAEMSELHDNFGRNGNSTAFLLRKTLEKLLIIVFAKNGRDHLLEDKARPGGWCVFRTKPATHSGVIRPPFRSKPATPLGVRLN